MRRLGLATLGTVAFIYVTAQLLKVEEQRYALEIGLCGAAENATGGRLFARDCLSRVSTGRSPVVTLLSALTL
ncbi:hypothetical protein SLNSH_19620 [Alsobacter soli]|uniref:Uncharacterized protein n=2 Tax=Alsobacter soli TaxID=2109933 RepID=A0A2T1HP19_9HYPH|nr:hypothetical protein SLNSH_19620 [Alsobacter soli]